jgi:hypothetical protein
MSHITLVLDTSRLLRKKRGSKRAERDAMRGGWSRTIRLRGCDPTLVRFFPGLCAFIRPGSRSGKGTRPAEAIRKLSRLPWPTGNDLGERQEHLG